MEDEGLLDDSTILVQDTQQNTSPDTVTRRIVNRLGFSSQSSSRTETVQNNETNTV